MTDEIAAGNAERRAQWESKWAQSEFAPRWHTTSIPDEVRQAVAEAWFPPGAAVLDIGCGDGGIAAWLAAQGFEVTGIDFAPAAIARAEAAHPGVQGLKFEVADICKGAPSEGRFGALLDRGCLHAVLPELRPDYVRSAATAAIPGGRFLLLFRVGPNTTREAIVASLESLCGTAFDVLRVSDAVLSDDSDEPHRGVALWMVRREEESSEHREDS